LGRFRQQVVEALERHRQVGTTLGGRDGVHLVDNDGLDAEQCLACRRGEHQIERLRSGDENVWGEACQQSTVLRRGVSRAHTDGDVGRGQAQSLCGLGYTDQRGAQVALHVYTECLQRGDVEDACAQLRVGRGLRSRGMVVEQPVDRPEKRRERFARTGGGDDKGVRTR
jgi:hypothetical protein